MKRIFLILAVLLVLFLVGCEQKEEPQNVVEEAISTEIEETVTDSASTSQKFSLDNLLIDNAWKENKVIKYDRNYEEEVLALIEDHNNSPFELYNNDEYDYPVLEIYEDGIKNTYVYSENEMFENHENVQDNNHYYHDYIVENIEAGLENYDEIVNAYKSIGDLDFETYMQHRYSNNKDYGLITVSYFDGKTEESIKGYLREDNRLGVKIRKDWDDNQGYLDIIVDGVDGEIVSVVYCGADDVVYDRHAYILTMNGDVYDAILNHEIFSEDRNPEDGEIFYAKKLESIKNAFAIDYVYRYPYMFEGIGESIDAWYSALTYEGRIYDLLLNAE